jgi:hypothetical protein
MLQVSLFDIPEPEKLPERPVEIPRDCPVPGYFPTCGGDPQKTPQRMEAIRRRDASALRLMRCKWWCLYCLHWHDFDDTFFAMFDGVYPHEITMAGDEWHQYFGGWEAKLRKLADLQELTQAQVFEFWTTGELQWKTESNE